ncbi:MAG TPA: TraR/DksA family transcriptional regulator [Bryobacteraceae bacterium]|nr:TraR/DksA family transcriptional regulator [Bryobacteraceae bacterium]
MMSTSELKNFEGALQTRARELLHAQAERRLIVVERSPDALDGTLQAAERERSARALGENFRLLRQVEAALARIRRGDFGICLSCEEEIPLRRLQAVPWAALCRSCQEKEEERQAFRPALARAA